MELPPYQVQAILTSLSMSADKGMRMGFSTNELTDEDRLLATKYHQQFGWLMFKPNPFTVEDMPKETAEDKNKTPSKRLRASLFILWKQEGENGDFEVYYREKMEKLIKYVQEKLD
jgi:hypothetical protein